jgi:hypothetical protein
VSDRVHNELLELWRQADDQWAREWMRQSPTLGLLLIGHQPPMADTGDERHGDWEYGEVGR